MGQTRYGGAILVHQKSPLIRFVIAGNDRYGKWDKNIYTLTLKNIYENNFILYMRLSIFAPLNFSNSNIIILKKKSWSFLSLMNIFIN